MKNGFTYDLAEFLIADLKRVIEYLNRLEGSLPAEPGEGFHH